MAFICRERSQTPEWEQHLGCLQYCREGQTFGCAAYHSYSLSVHVDPMRHGATVRFAPPAARDGRAWSASVLAPFSQVKADMVGYLDGIIVAKSFKNYDSSIQLHAECYRGPTECVPDHSIPPWCRSARALLCADSLRQSRCSKKRMKGKCRKRRVLRKCARSCGVCS